MEPLLHHDVVERIMEMLPVKSLLRFKAVSKQWQSTYFQKSQLNHREQSRDPDVLMVIESLVLGSLSSVKIPTSWENTFYSVCGNSCDGLVCLYHSDLCFAVNPATIWHRTLPRCHFQQKKTTTCELFDFSTNTWRFITTASAPYWISSYYDPVYVDGKLHWFTQCKETKVLSLHLHTETFQVISNVPFANVVPYNNNFVMCNLDNRLSVSQKMMSEQVIWLFSSGNKTWNKLCSIDLELTSLQFDIHISIPLLPLALWERRKKKKLLLCPTDFGRTLVIHDLETKSYDAAFSAESIGYPVCYFQSLISIL
ncbi:unnamed protein product [Brassica rapa subsp. trilocularis]